VLTCHIALSKIDYPDKLIFDLDPPEGNVKLAIKAAQALNNLLENELELKTYIMTSGSRGLHIVVPLKRHDNFYEVHEFAKGISQYIADKNPKEFTTAIKKEKRKGRVYIDFLRNSYAQTSVSPFSVRPIENAPVATPLEWTESKDTDFNTQIYNIHTIFKRLEEIENPWKDFDKHAQSTFNAKKKLEALENKV
jgi:bifunctional non-homologous end joining protein LigD